MSISIFWFVVCLVAAVGLGYYAAVMFNRPFDVSPGDIMEDAHPAVGEWDGYIPLTQPRVIALLKLDKLIYMHESMLSKRVKGTANAFTIEHGYVILHTDNGKYIIEIELFEKCDLSIYGAFVKAMEATMPMYVFDGIGSFTGDFKHEYGITTDYNKKLEELYDNTAPEHRHLVENHRDFLRKYAKLRFRQEIEKEDVINATLSDKDLVAKLLACGKDASDTIKWTSVVDVIDGRVAVHEIFARAHTLIDNMQDKVDEITESLKPSAEIKIPLQRGESVRLKSGGPVMRVEKHINGETIQCSWKEEGSQNRTQREFYTDTLEVVEAA